jgi:carbamoyl-phosphate synthase large subunit
MIPELETLVRQLSEAFRPIGPTNFQFRCHLGKFLLLEINPRISSSSSLRTAFGVNEPEMCIAYYLERKRPETGAIRLGSAARYVEDFVSYDCPDR